MIKLLLTAGILFFCLNILGKINWWYKKGFRTPPKPVDALITFLMSLAFQCAILIIRLSIISQLKHDPTLQGYHLFGDAVLSGLAFLFSFSFFLAGFVKLLVSKKEDKLKFAKVIRWNYGLVILLSCLFILEILWGIIR